METYDETFFREHCLNTKWMRQVVTRTDAKGTIRGLHISPVVEEHKLIRCSRGRIFDVLVDLRKDYPTYGHVATFNLRSSEPKMLYVPPGVAHGFQAMNHHVEVSYLMSTPYMEEQQSGVRWDSPKLAIPWPVPHPRLSERDKLWPLA